MRRVVVTGGAGFLGGHVCRALRAHGAEVVAVDNLSTGQRDQVADLLADPYAACTGARVLCLLTEWDEFRWLDYERVGQLLTRRAVVDARNLLDPAAMRHLGFAYEGVGR